MLDFIAAFLCSSFCIARNERGKHGVAIDQWALFHKEKVCRLQFTVLVNDAGFENEGLLRLSDCIWDGACTCRWWGHLTTIFCNRTFYDLVWWGPKNLVYNCLRTPCTLPTPCTNLLTPHTLLTLCTPCTLCTNLENLENRTIIKEVTGKWSCTPKQAKGQILY